MTFQWTHHERPTRELRRDLATAYGRVRYENVNSPVWTNSAPYQWANIGPIVRARAITVEGYGRWHTVAVTTAPYRYISAVAVSGDLTRHNTREGN